jgi:hypothetical protein
MFGYTAFPSIYGPSLTGIAGTARANDCLRPGNTEVRGKISCLCWGLNLNRPVIQSLAILTELPQLLVYNNTEVLFRFEVISHVNGYLE